ncbi:unnamed protein product, partial [Brenthis ino]
MNSKDLIFNALDISTSSLFFNDKETQTSIVHLINTVPSIRSTSRPAPENIDTSGKNDNVQKFEFCEIIQDPDDSDSITIIKETFTEEVLTTSDRSFFKTPSQNKFKYCKEVIQPYNKTYPNHCPSFPKDKCCKPKVDPPSEYPSTEEPIEPTMPTTEEINTINIKDISNETMAGNKSKATFINPEISPCDECRKKKEQSNSSCCSISSIKNADLPCEPPKPIEQECKKIDDCKLKSCISNCISESLNLAKKGSAACIEKFEKVIGIKQPKECNEKPTYYVMKKPKSNEPSSTELCPKSSLDSLLEAQSKAVATIKSAFKDFVGTVYNKTKDCVNLIKTESCKHLPRCDDSPPVKDCKSQSKTKVCNNISSATNTHTLLERISGQTSKTEENPENNSIKALIEPAKEVLENVASTVASTISILKNSSFEQIADNIINSKFNKSSPHDEPKITKTPPKPASQDHEPSTNSMFALIKTKLLSMFINQNTCDDNEDSEKDNEHCAEKLFEKYCDQ